MYNLCTLHKFAQSLYQRGSTCVHQQLRAPALARISTCVHQQLRALALARTCTYMQHSPPPAALTYATLSGSASGDAMAGVANNGRFVCKGAFRFSVRYRVG